MVKTSVLEHHLDGETHDDNHKSNIVVTFGLRFHPDYFFLLKTQ